MRQRVQDGFIIFLTMFDNKMKLSCIIAAPQEHCRPHPIPNLSVKHDDGMTSVNNTTDR